MLLQGIQGEYPSETSEWYESARHLELIGQYLDSATVEFPGVWPWLLQKMEPILLMMSPHLLHRLPQVEKRIDCCMDCLVPSQEEGNVS